MGRFWQRRRASLKNSIVAQSSMRSISLNFLPYSWTRVSPSRTSKSSTRKSRFVLSLAAMLRAVTDMSQIEDMIEQLASLLLPIDAVLAHEDFNPQIKASSEIVALFRNTWFLCVLFDFTQMDDRESTAMDWLRPALTRIALKTPATVVEESLDAVASDVEYNSVIRQEYAHTVYSLLFILMLSATHDTFRLSPNIAASSTSTSHCAPAKFDTFPMAK